MTKKLCLFTLFFSFFMAFVMENDPCFPGSLCNSKVPSPCLFQDLNPENQQDSYNLPPEPRIMVQEEVKGKQGCVMPKILIFTSGGGGGHLSASNALQSYFEPKFQVQQSSIFSEVLGKFDPLAVVTGGYISEESFYNYLIKRQQFGLFNKVVGFAQSLYDWFDMGMTQRVKSYLEDQKPDLVISVAPLANHAIAQACASLDLPFLLNATDTDTALFTYNMGSIHHLDYMINIPFMYDPVEKRLKEDAVDMSHVVSYGFPLRKDFYEKKNIPALKNKHNVPLNKPVILVMMGAQGSTGIFTIVQSLTKLTKCAHVIAILGNSYEELKPQIDDYLKSNGVRHVAFDLIERTNRMSDFMAMADVIVGKSGGATVCEAIQMQRPMFLDATKTPVIWEQMSQKFMQENNLGFIVHDFHDLGAQIAAYLDNAVLQKRVKQSLARYFHDDTPKKMYDMCMQLLQK